MTPQEMQEMLMRIRSGQGQGQGMGSMSQMFGQQMMRGLNPMQGAAQGASSLQDPMAAEKRQQGIQALMGQSQGGMPQQQQQAPGMDSGQMPGRLPMQPMGQMPGMGQPQQQGMQAMGQMQQQPGGMDMRRQMIMEYLKKMGMGGQTGGM
jgi:hypothetical protein